MNRESAKNVAMVVASVPVLMGLLLYMAALLVMLGLMLMTALPGMAWEHWRGR